VRLGGRLGGWLAGWLAGLVAGGTGARGLAGAGRAALLARHDPTGRPAPQVLHKGLGEDKYRPCPLLAQYVDAGWLGRKAGKGVYAYDSDDKAEGA
jgi:hypothetical protein